MVSWPAGYLCNRDRPVKLVAHENGAKASLQARVQYAAVAKWKKCKCPLQLQYVPTGLGCGDLLFLYA